jgi:hypothetical protein
LAEELDAIPAKIQAFFKGQRPASYASQLVSLAPHMVEWLSLWKSELAAEKKRVEEAEALLQAQEAQKRSAEEADEQQHKSDAHQARVYEDMVFEVAVWTSLKDHLELRFATACKEQQQYQEERKSDSMLDSLWKSAGICNFQILDTATLFPEGKGARIDCAKECYAELQKRVLAMRETAGPELFLCDCGEIHAKYFEDLVNCLKETMRPDGMLVLRAPVRQRASRMHLEKLLLQADFEKEVAQISYEEQRGKAYLELV